jgi:hypothetical protein
MFQKVFLGLIILVGFAPAALAQQASPVFAAMDLSGVFDAAEPKVHIAWEYPESAAVRDETQILADSFADVIDRDFLPRDPYAGLEVVMTADENAFKSYMREHYPTVQVPRFGLYVEEGKLVTHSRSGFGTITSLLVPGLLRHQYDDLPQWAMTGLRTYFEKVYGYWDTDIATGRRTICFAFGYHNPWRLDAIKLQMPDLQLKDLVSETPVEEDSMYQSRQRMLIMFIWKEGKLPAFVKALKARNHKMYPTYLEAVFGQPIEVLQPRFQAFQESILANWKSVMMTPPSQLYSDKATFEASTASIWR